MINTTDLQECEVLLPGDWIRKDNGDIYSFTTERMEFRDERLFRQLYIRHAKKGKQPEAVSYALTIKDDYCGLLLGNEEFIIRQITKRPDGSASMEWQDPSGLAIFFERKQ
jgi:hypothetical protein